MAHALVLDCRPCRASRVRPLATSHHRESRRLNTSWRVSGRMVSPSGPLALAPPPRIGRRRIRCCAESLHKSHPLLTGRSGAKQADENGLTVLSRPLMNQQNRYPPDQYPPTRDLADAIRRLPKPGPDVLPQQVQIDAGPAFGRFNVTFVPRQNPALNVPTWFWGVGRSERIDTGSGCRQELNDPESGGG